MIQETNEQQQPTIKMDVNRKKKEQAKKKITENTLHENRLLSQAFGFVSNDLGFEFQKKRNKATLESMQQ